MTFPSPPPVLPVIDVEQIRVALYAWPFSPLRDCLQAAGIASAPVERLIETDPAVASLVTFWLNDREGAEPDDDPEAVPA